MNSNQNILVFGTRFFGYIDRIVKRLREKNAIVDLKYTFSDNFYSRSLRTIPTLNSYEIYDNYKINYYQDIINSLSKGYDTVFILNGINLPDVILAELKKKYQNARFVLYLWDDRRFLNFTPDFINSFDSIFTYSFSDSKTYGFKYRPFFYSEEIDREKIIDISFIGTLHGKRYETIDKIKYANNNLIFSNYFYSDFFTYLIDSFKNQFKSKDIYFKKLDYDAYVDRLACSTATIEIAKLNQITVTTRAIETIGTRTKLITFSKSIMNSDFYNENNIFILKKDQYPELKEWLQIPYKTYDKNITYYYSLDCWIEEIFNTI